MLLKINLFLLFKLPSAWLCGVRLSHLSTHRCETYVRYRWINSNPFRSMYFAVQAMAAELSTGALVMNALRRQNHNSSMLVVSCRATFQKKAVGKINFECNGGEILQEAIQAAAATGVPQKVWLKSTGRNRAGEQVCEMEFEWSLKLAPLNSP